MLNLFPVLLSPRNHPRILTPICSAFATLLLSLGITSGLPTPAVLRPILLVRGCGRRHRVGRTLGAL